MTIDQVINVLAALALCEMMAALGLSGRQRRRLPADTLTKPANVLTNVLGLILLGLVLVVQFDMLTGTPLRFFGGMWLLLAATLAIGWLLDQPGADNRKTLALNAAVRLMNHRLGCGGAT